MQPNKQKGFRFFSSSLNTKIIFFPKHRVEVLNADAFPLDAVWLRLLPDHENVDVPYEMVKDANVIATLNTEAANACKNWAKSTPQSPAIGKLMDAAESQGSTVGAYAQDMSTDDDDLLFDIGKL